jgi:hypothetical protein
VGQAPVKLFRPAVALGPDQHTGRHGKALEHLADALDIDSLVERLAHAPVGERIAPLDLRRLELGSCLIETEIDRLGALDLLDLEARRCGNSL